MIEYRDSAVSSLNEHSRVTVDSEISIWLKKIGCRWRFGMQVCQLVEVKHLLSLTTVGRCSFKSFTVSPTENIKEVRWTYRPTCTLIDLPKSSFKTAGYNKSKYFILLQVKCKVKLKGTFEKFFTRHFLYLYILYTYLFYIFLYLQSRSISLVVMGQNRIKNIFWMYRIRINKPKMAYSRDAFIRD